MASKVALIRAAFAVDCASGEGIKVGGGEGGGGEGDKVAGDEFGID